MIKLNLFNIFVRRQPQLGKSVTFSKGYNRLYINNLPVKSNDEVLLLEAFPTDSEVSAQTVVKNLKKQECGRHEYKLWLQNREFSGEYIEVYPPFRNQRLGELLKLASIIEMKANNLDKITLYSLPEAIKFHAKFGFTPNIKSSDPISLILKEITEKNQFSDLSEQSLQMLKGLSGKFHLISGDEMKNINNFFSVYIKRCISENTPVFNKKIAMILTEKSINKNADYYNNLFEKHEINFKV